MMSDENTEYLRSLFRGDNTFSLSEGKPDSFDFKLSSEHEELLYAIFKKLFLRTKSAREYYGYAESDLVGTIICDSQIFYDKMKSFRDNVLDCFNASLLAWLRDKNGNLIK